MRPLMVSRSAATLLRKDTVSPISSRAIAMADRGARSAGDPTPVAASAMAPRRQIIDPELPECATRWNLRVYPRQMCHRPTKVALRGTLSAVSLEQGEGMPDACALLRLTLGI
jgi:hypothetical protein